MKSARSHFPTLLALLIVAPLALAGAPPPAAKTVSLLHVRIVRLSFVQGKVAVRQPGATEWSRGVVNTPLQQGFSVATSADSFAEIEFENGSTARLGQDTQINLNELALTQQGGKINHLTLTRGYATFHFTPEQHDQYLVDASGLKMTIHGQTEFRTDLGHDRLRLEVFKGKVDALHDGKTIAVGDNHVLNFNATAAEAMNVTDGIHKDAWDKWTEARDTQAELANNDSPASLNHPLYGWSELDTYGAWSDFPGYGQGWAPYEPAGWSPYSAGQWDNYPGWGLTWVSAEPWGWLPYHTGVWNYDPSMGWFWMPNSLMSWSPALVNWYEGPGWFGWSPVGGSGACAFSVSGCLEAVTPGTLSSGTPLHSGSSVFVRLPTTARGTPIHPPRLSDRVSGQAVTVLGPHVTLSDTTGTSAAMSPSAPAPSSVVMGREVAPATFLHHGFFSGPRVIHAPLGRTLGGVVPTVTSHNGNIALDSHYHGAPSTARPGAFTNPGMRRAAELRRPVLIPHGNNEARRAMPAASIQPGPPGFGGPPSNGPASSAMSMGAPSGSAPSSGSGGFARAAPVTGRAGH